MQRERVIQPFGLVGKGLTIAILLGILVQSNFEPCSADSEVALDGYFKDYTTNIRLADFPLSAFAITPGGSHVASSNRLRLNLRAKSTGIWSLHIAYDLTLLVQSRELFGPVPIGGIRSAREYRVTDLDDQLYPESDKAPGTTAMYQNLDRLRLIIRTAPLDIIVGRQAIAWGAARVINPTDVVSPFGYTQLDTENRIGVDAIRVRVPTGPLSEFDIGYIAGSNFEADSSTLFARYSLNISGADVSGIGMRVGDHAVAGIDLVRSLGGAGIWIEAAYLNINHFKDEDTVGSSYTRVSAGLDYSFSSVWYTFLEYHYSGPGSNNSDDYFKLLFQQPMREGLIYLMGKHYLAPGAVYQITPLWIASAGALVNLGDPSALLSPRLEYNVAENAYLEAGAHIGMGRAPYLEDLAFPATSTILRLGSEFGWYADQLYFSFRYYF